jgi:acyl carrier protein
MEETLEIADAHVELARGTAGPMTRTKIEEQVLGALGAVVPAAKGRALDPDALIRDQVELDSMDFLDFVLAVERRFSIDVSPTSYPQFATIAHAVECVERLLENAPAARPAARPGRLR